MFSAHTMKKIEEMKKQENTYGGFLYRSFSAKKEESKKDKNKEQAIPELNIEELQIEGVDMDQPGSPNHPSVTMHRK